ncbi:MAG: DUF4058 family protein [Planctomycetaceae bacterium]
MPLHDWTKVEAGIFHHFHHEWISAISAQLNGELPSDYYALAEQFAGGFGPDVLTLQSRSKTQSRRTLKDEPDSGDGGAVLLARPKTRLSGEAEFYRHKQKRIAIRHISDDRVIAVVEIVSPGNKSSRAAVRAFLDKAVELLQNGVHRLLIDLFPPTRRDPDGLHSLIWANVTNRQEESYSDKPLMMVSYEAGDVLRYFAEPIAVGDQLAAMPLFLEPNAHIDIALESTYASAFAAVPRRWREELE